MNKEQNNLMLVDPATYHTKPYPSHAKQWREFHGNKAWLYNPWTGDARSAEDVDSDTFGKLITPPQSKMHGIQLILTKNSISAGAWLT